LVSERVAADLRRRTYAHLQRLSLEFFGGKMAARDFAAGVEARLHHKDFGTLLAEAHGVAAPLPVAAQVSQQLNALMALGLGGDDSASLLRVLERAGARA
jgi:2-hydroxy-3-oxopropionate reductase